MSSSVLPPLSVRASAITGSAIRDLLSLTVRPGILSLAGGLPSPDVMPHSTIRDVAHRILGGSTAALQYAETAGVRRLRDVIAARESALVHDEVSPASVVVTHGSQQALSLLASVLVDPGDVVVVDRPVYPGALQAFQAVGARIESVPVDTDGTDTDALARLLESGVRPLSSSTRSPPRGTWSSPVGMALGAPDGCHVFASVAADGRRHRITADRGMAERETGLHNVGDGRRCRDRQRQFA